MTATSFVAQRALSRMFMADVPRFAWRKIILVTTLIALCFFCLVFFFQARFVNRLPFFLQARRRASSYDLAAAISIDRFGTLT